MIIKDAYEQLEVTKSNTVDAYCSWDYLSFISNGKCYRIVFEMNKAYGLDFARQWSIDLVTETDVPDKYFKGENVNFDCSSGLCGIRAFENDSLTWEFLWKPLGVPYEAIKDRKHPWSMGAYELKRILEENGIQYQEVMHCRY